MKAVMYHYVRSSVCKPPWYYHLTIDDFKAQLDYFENRFGFADRDSFLSAVAANASPPEGVVLTFDDGLRDHYEWVFPELMKRGLWGIFYIPAGPYINETVLNVHRVHALLGKYGGDTLLQPLLDLISEDMIPDARRKEFRNETYQNQSNHRSVTAVKRILNYFISYEYREDVLNALDDRFPAADIDPEDLYMGPVEMQEMNDSGMILGSHSVSHRVFSKLSQTAQRDEIVRSFEFLEGILDGLEVRTFCYPYGGFHTFTNYTRSILSEVGSLFSFNVKSRDIASEDFRVQPQALPRYDCNEFKHGNASGRIG